MVQDRLLEQTLRERFGFEEFRPGQREAIAALLKTNRALAVFPTGAGKSLCYQLPALMIDGLTLVVSPLIALMKDQIDFLKAKGIAAARLDSSLTSDEVRVINQAIQSGDLKLLYVSPERFNNERFLGDMKRADIGLFAVDEAHCISEWGHNFRPDYLKLAEMAKDIGAERILALTATATPSVVEDICQAFDIPRESAIVTGFYRPNLTFLTSPAAGGRRDAALVERIKERPPGSTIVYVTLQKTAERVAAALTGAGLPAKAYHAGMESEQRHQVQDWWMAAPDGIVVATIAFGMGIDKADVRYVYHYNLPKSLESLSQEVGRAGRDGLPSIVETLPDRADIPVLENFAYGDTPDIEAVSGLVKEVLGGPVEFDLSIYEASMRHDIRQLVLRTALTYLELLGALKQGTPFYAGYEFQALASLPEIFGAFSGEPRELVQSILNHAKKGRIWYSLNPESAATLLGKERKRIVRALEVLAERGMIELRASDVRNRYTRLAGPGMTDRLTEELMERFERREDLEIQRLAKVVELIESPTCQVNFLTAYFGERREEPCGHCTVCLTGMAQTLPPTAAPEDLATLVPESDFKELAAKFPNEIGNPRKAARFLCGLTSPALTRSKLSRHALFGALESVPFAQVMDWAKKAQSAK